MATTLFLNPLSWDLELDVNRNIATAISLYQQAQDICSACRTMIKDMYYQQKQGIPYLEEILGTNTYSLALYRQQLQEKALEVEGVTSAQVNLYFANRKLQGTIEFTNIEGQTATINL